MSMGSTRSPDRTSGPLVSSMMATQLKGGAGWWDRGGAARARVHPLPTSQTLLPRHAPSPQAVVLFDEVDDRLVRRVVAVAHVEARHVHARVRQRKQALARARRRPNRAHHLGLARQRVAAGRRAERVGAAAAAAGAAVDGHASAVAGQGGGRWRWGGGAGGERKGCWSEGVGSAVRGPRRGRAGPFHLPRDAARPTVDLGRAWGGGAGRRAARRAARPWPASRAPPPNFPPPHAYLFLDVPPVLALPPADARAGAGARRPAPAARALLPRAAPAEGRMRVGAATGAGMEGNRARGVTRGGQSPAHCHSQCGRRPTMPLLL